MEISEKNKKTIVGLSILAVGGISLGIILYHYRKPKEIESDELYRGIDPYDELGYDRIEQVRMPKLTKSRWRNIDEMLESGEKDARENYNKNRNRFTIYDSGRNIVEKRFKVLQTHGNGTGRAGRRLRVSGDIYKKTPSGYNFNQKNRNANFSDLIIP